MDIYRVIYVFYDKNEIILNHEVMFMSITFSIIIFLIKTKIRSNFIEIHGITWYSVAIRVMSLRYSCRLIILLTKNGLHIFLQRKGGCW